jgi:hypothetical protein
MQRANHHMQRANIDISERECRSIALPEICTDGLSERDKTSYQRQIGIAFYAFSKFPDGAF